MSDRVVVRMRVATTQPMDVYGGVRIAPRILDQIVDRIRSGRMPMELNHDPMNAVEARVVNAQVVDTEDGYKAVDAEVEVDREAWDRFQAHLDEVGEPGGASFSGTTLIRELPPDDPSAVGQFAVSADAGYFEDADIIGAAQQLTPVGSVRACRLYQFSAVPACRIVVDYVHATGGLDAAGRALEIGTQLVVAAIYDCLKHLLARRPRLPRHPLPPHVPQPDSTQSEPAQIELRTKTPDGVEQTLVIRTDDPAVVRRALDHVLEATSPQRPVTEWDDDHDRWRDPQSDTTAT